ncbi:DUF4188 domain-containing protein [Silvanigrella aquatica]|uniref:Transcriptional regulator n=1 Tax=Silvanigrella aquatica TaxID=1915309 RepID=A0A1L4D2C6_9BACT|nr:DUF4188 domain-containing protein [Silvanigrella aquatica]APJ04341.1 transcriptional regulator [Silvanigrella aquatica]
MAINKGKFTAKIEGDFVIFLIGMRINNFLKFHKWMPIASQMPKMINELYKNPDFGFLHHEIWIGGFFSKVMVVQYWQSLDQLISYANNKNAQHLPAWASFHKKITDHSVGIWHETYLIKEGNYETIYHNMPTFGLGKAGQLEAIQNKTLSAKLRLGLK